MSQENVEVVRRAHVAAANLDTDSFIECCDPEVQWEENTSVFLGLRSCYRGHKGASEWFSDALVEFWSDLQVEFEFTARGKTSGVATRLRIWEVYWLRQSKIIRRQPFSTEADALKAVGLEE